MFFIHSKLFRGFSYGHTKPLHQDAQGRFSQHEHNIKGTSQPAVKSLEMTGLLGIPTLDRQHQADPKRTQNINLILRELTRHIFELLRPWMHHSPALVLLPGIQASKGKAHLWQHSHIHTHMRECVRSFVATGDSLLHCKDARLRKVSRSIYFANAVS